MSSAIVGSLMATELHSTIDGTREIDGATGERARGRAQLAKGRAAAIEHAEAFLVEERTQHRLDAGGAQRRKELLQPKPRRRR